MLSIGFLPIRYDATLAGLKGATLVSVERTRSLLEIGTERSGILRALSLALGIEQWIVEVVRRGRGAAVAS